MNDLFEIVVRNIKDYFLPNWRVFNIFALYFAKNTYC